MFVYIYICRQNVYRFKISRIIRNYTYIWLCEHTWSALELIVDMVFTKLFFSDMYSYKIYYQYDKRIVVVNKCHVNDKIVI